LCVVGWNCLPLAQALSIEVAATSVIGRFVTTRERVMVSRPFAYHEQLYVQPQGQLASARRTSITGFTPAGEWQGEGDSGQELLKWSVTIAKFRSGQTEK
jgi:hypothetical protein